MKVGPIIMTADSVRAILEGRKWQTRRTNGLESVNVRPDLWHSPCYLGRGNEWRLDGVAGNGVDALIRCPYGQGPGDRLWVRETLQWGARNNPEPRLNHVWRYVADNKPVLVSKDAKSDVIAWAHHKDGETCSSIHMPRWASRLTLEITEVRVQRVQEISEEDAEAEGVYVPQIDGTLRSQYELIWNTINRKRGFPWESNPLVWAITFKKLP